MDINAILQDLSTKSGTTLMLDNDNRLTLNFDDLYDVTLELNKDNNTVCLYASILAKASSLSKNNLLMLLQDNLLGVQTKGCSFAINKQNDELVLYKLHENSFADVYQFENELNSFIEIAITYVEKLDSMKNDNEDNNYLNTTANSAMSNMLMV